MTDTLQNEKKIIDLKIIDLKKLKSGVKLCNKCNKVKSLSTGFYKAGSSWQKYCKPCHNERRSEYDNPNHYTPRPIGFLKLPEELRNKIIYDIYVRVNFKDIQKKYKPEYPEMCSYITLLKWNKAGQIPTYDPSTGIKPNYEEKI